MKMKIEASASGKVLIAGGYLITEAPNVGLVLSVSARMTTTLECTPRAAPLPSPAFTLHSPQFHFRETYTVSIPDSGGAPAISPDGNPFLLGTLRLLFEHYASAALSLLFSSHDVLLTVVGADAFYSPPAAPGDIPRKTGLGSSAALVTSVVAAFSALVLAASGDLPTSGDGDRPDSRDSPTSSAGFRDRVHALAQYAHCACQGKVGSGFDIAAAVYGSQVYARFSPQLVSMPVADLPLGAWGARREAALPPALRLLLGDVAAGAETPGMVRKVDTWRRALPIEALEKSPWAQLSELNRELVSAYEKLCQDGAAIAERLAYDRVLTDDATGAVGEFRRVFLRVRRTLKAMGAASGADIEPDAQTALCDRTQALPGVLACGVPGAGGMDAVFVLCARGAAENVQKRWEEWGVRALPLEEDARGLWLEETEL